MHAVPCGSGGERRTADVVANAVRVMRVAIGEEEDDREDQPARCPAQQFGKLGEAARPRNLSPERKQEIARKAAAKRWGRKGR